MLYPPFCRMLTNSPTMTGIIVLVYVKVTVESILKSLGINMLCFTTDICNRGFSPFSHECPLHRAALTHIPTQLHSFLSDLPWLSMRAKKSLRPDAKSGPLPHQQHLAARQPVSLSSPLYHTTWQCWGENDMEGEAEGTEPLLASGLLSALVVIWKQS